ncbi:MAG: hypothetical protein RLZ91_322 [Bacteroidota bacterium]
MVQMLVQKLSECHIVSKSMSHSSIRQESTCLNCGQNVHDRFCSYCGQENREPHETFWSLLVHFVEDIFHYDGKLFTTVKQLFMKPGYLSAEYLKGKRTVYLHPIRFYLFTSAFFFICLFYVFHPLAKILHVDEAKNKAESSESILTIQNGLIQDKKDNPKTYEAYLFQQSKLPLEKRDTEFEQKLIKQVYTIGKQYTNPAVLFEDLVETMLHKMSTLLFIALPLLAFLLQLVFIRRKGYYYMHHGIFVLHIATSLFLALFVTEILGLLAMFTHIAWLDALGVWLIYAWGIYYFVAFKRFYQLKWKKALVYFTGAVFLQNVLLMVIFLGLLVFSFFSL